MTLRNALSTVAGIGIAAAAAMTMLVPNTAEACGGFFCNRGAPVNQSGEHILFAVEGNETEAHVLVNYQGDSEDFAWIVPTPSEPEVGVSTATIFQRLDQMVAPRFMLNWQYIGECNWNTRGDAFDEDGGLAGGAPPGETENDSGVTVVNRGSVGPYDYAVLQATGVEPLFEWLEANNYDIPDTTMPLVEPYVLMGNDIHFVAFKLSKDSDVGDLQPIRLRYESTEPMIPIQLTAVATEPDMGVTAHVLGTHRAVPDNYLHVHINEARIDWLNGAWNYDEVVTEAMNEAGGHGFATEFAGNTDIFESSFFVEGQMDTAALAELDDPIQFFNALQAQGFQGDPQLLNLLQAWIPIPQEVLDMGVDARSFYNCLECYAEYIDRESFDAEGFANELELTIVGPLRHAQDLFDRIPYLTRMYSTLSAEEMTLDPVFVFNDDMGDVSNVHEADAIVECNGGDPWNQPVTIRLEDGRSIVVDQTRGGEAWDDFDGLPAAETIEETGSRGQPAIIADNGTTIDSYIDDNNEETLERFERERGGCTVGSSPSTPGGGLLAVLGAAILALRRRK